MPSESENKTPNIGLNQWEGNEYVKRQDFVDDNLIIDAEIKKLKDATENIEVPVTSVNDKIGAVVLTASDVGAETPGGAQTKADAALTAANYYTDTIASYKVDKEPGKRLMTDAEGTKLNGIAAGAQVNPTASQILDSLKTVDGAGSGLDADLFRGLAPSAFLQGTDAVFVTGTYTGNGNSSRHIVLGFKPKAVIVMNNAGAVYTYNSKHYGGLALNGFDVIASNGITTTLVIAVSATGFYVYKGVLGQAEIMTNTNDVLYHYIAFR